MKLQFRPKPGTAKRELFDFDVEAHEIHELQRVYQYREIPYVGEIGKALGSTTIIVPPVGIPMTIDCRRSLKALA